MQDKNIGRFENVINNVWNRYQASNGYSTAFLYTLSNFEIIYNKNKWLSDLKQQIQTEYPTKLQQNIIKRNMMLLYNKPFSSYFEQIKKAVARNDLVSINHRSAAFLASYFDIIFALKNL